MPTTSDKCEAYILELYKNEWTTAGITAENRPDYDVILNNNNSKRSFEVKTQGAAYPEFYIELGEINSKNKIVKNTDKKVFRSYKAGFTASEADTYVIFKGKYPNYHIYEINKRTLQKKIDDILKYMDAELIDDPKDIDKFILKSIDSDEPLEGWQSLIKNKKYQILDYNDKNLKYIADLKITSEENDNIYRNNLNVLILPKDIEHIDKGIHDISTIFENNSISDLFNGIKIDKYDNETLNELKKTYDEEYLNINYITNSWKYELSFSKNVEKKYNISLNQILDLKPKMLVDSYIMGETPDKKFGLEGYGKYVSPSNSDSSSSSEDDRTCRKVYNRIKRNIDKKYKTKKEKYL
jgi:hypothetical protein